MKLGLLGFSGDDIKSRTDNLGIYRPESNRHIQDFTGRIRFYQYYGRVQVVSSTTLKTLTGLTFSSNGTYVYVTADGDNTVYQYSLNTPWDITTLNSGSVLSKELDTYMYSQTGGNYRISQPSGITFSPDGYKMIVVDRYYNTIIQFSLSNPWMVNSATFTNTTVDNDRPLWTVSDSEPRDVCFSNDGDRLFILASASTSPYDDVVTLYTLNSGATAFDIGTKGSPNYTAYQSLNVNSLDNTMRGLSFSNNGLKLYVCGLTQAQTYEINLSTPFFYDSNNPVNYEDGDFLYDGYITGHEGVPEAVFMNRIGNNVDLYITGSESRFGASGQNLIHQYRLIQK